MSHTRDDLQIRVPLAEAMRACREAGPLAGMKIRDEGNDWMHLRGRLLRALGNPASYHLHLEERAPGTTIVSIDARMIGVGPLVRWHLNRDLRALKNSIERHAKTAGVTSDRVAQCTTGWIANVPFGASPQTMLTQARVEAYRGHCDCGWYGPSREHFSEAQADVHAHNQAIVTAPAGWDRW